MESQQGTPVGMPRWRSTARSTALKTLKSHDAEKNSSLYETLFHFLINERNTQRTAQALHIHKNSMLYRLNQIRELVDLDLDNPELRLYLILSYYNDADNVQQ